MKSYYLSPCKFYFAIHCKNNLKLKIYLFLRLYYILNLHHVINDDKVLGFPTILSLQSSGLRPLVFAPDKVIFDKMENKRIFDT